jgi:peroxin-6
MILLSLRFTDSGYPPELLNAQPPPHKHPWPLTPRYYLAEMAPPAELEVVVQAEDFESALRDLVPSVSAEEMAHYANVQKQFSKETMNSKQVKENGVHDGPVPGKVDKGKGKARMVDGDE